jgi:serine/threonine-protein kinase
MNTCPSCDSSVPEESRFCGSCGASLETPTSAPTQTTPRGDGPVTSHPSLETARFATGAVIANRYRIVGLLGRGGMGEVYRADDLKLGQPVALKFLPAEFEQHRGRLDRFLNEVKLALKVTHTNVCRVYDVSEFEGQHYLSMEYVDGEDLSSLLRRIGRLPEDKAVQAARQICAGLASAHDQGILHRDLKPANVMIDGRGQVKITDFGLAGLAGGFYGDEVKAGTPLYMSPEQLAGREVSARSDIYSLGLVLYELFTGKRPFEGSTPAEVARGRESAPTSPASIITNIDPAVERIILRCLERNPQDRPGSALAVAAALPGGDPLAAALAAGETPSPELIAEAGQSGGLKPVWAVPLLAASLIAVVLLIALSSETNLCMRAALDKPPEVLVDRAREVIESAGWSDPPTDSLYTFVPNKDYYRHILGSDPAPNRWAVSENAQPPMVLFAYRQSQQLLVRSSAGSIGDWLGDPPRATPGMVTVQLDAEGRLFGMLAVPPQRINAGDLSEEPDWNVLFEAAGLERESFKPVEPEWTPPHFANRHVAWEGSYPDSPDTPIRIEAAAFGRLPVAFWTIEPWTEMQELELHERGFRQEAGNVISVIIFFAAVAGAAILAFRNVRAGRGDSTTALRFALYLGAVRLFWLLGAHHLPSAKEEMVLRSHAAWALYRVGLVYVLYLALEPYARRLWPRMLVSWVRLIGGRFRDPLVGRDLLVGVAYGLCCALLTQVASWLPQIYGMEDFGLRDSTSSWEALRGLRHAAGGIAITHAYSVIMIFISLATLLVLRVICRNTWIAIALATTLFFFVFLPPDGSLFFFLPAFLLVMALHWAMLFRFGLLTVVVGSTVKDLFETLPLTFDLTAWYADATLLTLAFVLALTCWGFWVSLAGRPLFRDEILGAEGPH